MLVILALVVAACLAVAVLAGLAIVIIAVRGEDRRMSLKRDPVTRSEAATRCLLGVWVRQPEDAARPARAERR